MQIEILHTPGCADTPATAALARDVLAALGQDAQVLLRDVAASPDPRFAGSPTVLVDGRDLEPEVSRVEGFS